MVTNEHQDLKAKNSHFMLNFLQFQYRPVLITITSHEIQYSAEPWN